MVIKSVTCFKMQLMKSELKKCCVNVYQKNGLGCHGYVDLGAV